MPKWILFIERISGISGVIIAWLVLPLIIATVYEVFARYVLNAPTIWSYELGYMAMGAHFIIGAAYALREKAHIRIDVLYSQFPTRTRAMLDVLGYLILFFPVIIWLQFGLWEYWFEAFQSGEGSGQSAWNPPIWPFRVCFFTGFFLLLLQGFAQFSKSVMAVAGADWAIKELEKQGE